MFKGAVTKSSYDPKRKEMIVKLEYIHFGCGLSGHKKIRKIKLKEPR